MTTAFTSTKPSASARHTAGRAGGRWTRLLRRAGMAAVSIAVLAVGVLAPLPAAAADAGALTVTVAPVDSVDGSAISSIAYGQHQDQIAYRVQLSCSVADCSNAAVTFSPSQLDPYGLLPAPGSSVHGSTMLQYGTWTAPSGAGTPTGSDTTGWTFPVGNLAAGASLTFDVIYDLPASAPGGKAKAGQFYPDGFAIEMSATASADQATSVNADAAAVTWHNQVPDPSVGVWAPDDSVAPDTDVTVRATMSSGSFEKATNGPVFEGLSKWVAASNYTVVMTLPVQAVPATPVVDGGVYDSAAHTITWTRGTETAPDVEAAGGWGLQNRSGWYGNPTYHPRDVVLNFPGTNFTSSGCGFTETLPISVSTTVTYLDPARTTKTASTTDDVTVTCVPPFPGSNFTKTMYWSGHAYARDVADVPQPGQPANEFYWHLRALNFSNVEGAATIEDNGLDLDNMSVYRVRLSDPGTIEWTLDDGTTGTATDVTSLDAPAGRHYASITVTSGTIAPGRNDPTDGSYSEFYADLYFHVNSTAPVGETRTNEASSTMSWPSEAANPDMAPQTISDDLTVTFVGTQPAIEADFAGPAVVSGGGLAVPGRDVTFTVDGTATNVPTSSDFTPEYVFIAPEGWTINQGSASFEQGTVPDGVEFSYATTSIDGADRDVVVATWPTGSAFSSMDPLPTMSVVAQPTNSAARTSTATAWIGDSARNWDDTGAQWTAPVQNTPDVDGTGDTEAWFSSANQNVTVASVTSVSVIKEICQPDPSQADGCDWVSTPGTTVPVSVDSDNITYRVTIHNTGNTALGQVVAYDVLPFVGDTGLIPATEGSPRGSGFNENLVSVSDVSANLSLSYSAATNPSRPEVSPNGTVDDWGATASGKQAIRAAVTGDLAADATASFTYTAAVGAGAVSDADACNSVAIGSAQTAPAEPLPVCAQLTTNPALNLVKSADLSALSATPQVGEVITYHFTVTNAGDVPVTNVSVDDALAGVSAIDFEWPGSEGALDAGQAVTGDATYAITQADLDAGHVENSASAHATAPGDVPIASDPAQVDTVLTQSGGITLSKTAKPTTVSQAGDVITYTLTATNTGNVTLTDVSVVDPKPGVDVQSTDWPGDAEVLSPGQSVVVTTTYTVTQNDLNSGAIDNSAQASGTVPAGSVVTDDSSATVLAPAHAELTLVKSAAPTDSASYVLGQQIEYTFTVTNSGNVTVGDASVEETSFDGVTPPTVDCSGGATTLDPGDQLICHASYTLSQADIDRTETTNTAVARGTATDGSTVESAESTVVVPGVANPAISLSKSADTTEVTAAGQTVQYDFVITNSGNVTLSSVAVNDAMPGLSAVDYTWPGDAGTLAPGQVVHATASYIVTQADMDAGEFANSARATAAGPLGATVQSATASVTIRAAQQPELTVVKTASDPSAHRAGGVIDYGFTVTNTGNLTMTDVAVSDALPGLSELAYVWPGAPGVLAPGQVATATASYTLTQADIDSGHIANTATATATPPQAAELYESEGSSTDVPLERAAAIALVKSASPDDAEHFTVGQKITYAFLITNTGNVTVTAAGVTETKFTGHGTRPDVVCPASADTLAPGDDVTCHAVYTVTAADLAAGSLTNTATAHAIDPAGDDVMSDPSTVRIVKPKAVAAGLASTGLNVDSAGLVALLMLVAGLVGISWRRRKHA